MDAPFEERVSSMASISGRPVDRKGVVSRVEATASG
jgi:hypothetical protein